MMLLRKSKLKENQTIAIGGSKSISNRLLILEKLFGNISIHNISDSKDSLILEQALSSADDTIDIGHAGTAMRFLTAFFAVQEGRTVLLTGSGRMKQRPVGFLVNALRELGAQIEYTEKESFPPLQITGTRLTRNQVTIPAHISSQFISALLLIGAKLPNGLHVKLEGEVTSKPYIELTLNILTQLGISNRFEKNRITVQSLTGLPMPKAFRVESDWSSASYFYALAALGRKTIQLKSFFDSSKQGDARIAEIFERNFGIHTCFTADLITLNPVSDFQNPARITLNMNDCPDLAQTVCVVAAALRIPFKISGLATLKIKETDRLLALQNELRKTGACADITDATIQCDTFEAPDSEIIIKTYDDHRMAMSFAPLCLLYNVRIENPAVVEKSYPAFWQDLNSLTIIDP